MRHHLDRIDRYSGALGAFITVTADQALERAAAADSSLATGEAPAFTGVPTAIKDLTLDRRRTDVDGLGGDARLRADGQRVCRRPDRGAGFISLGKTNTPEFGLSSYTDNDLIGPARTPGT